MPHFGFFTLGDCLIFPSLYSYVWFGFRLIVLTLIRLGFMHADFDPFYRVVWVNYDLRYRMRDFAFCI